VTETQTVPVTDEFGAADDPAMSFLALALDPREVERQLACCLPSLTARNKSFQLRAIRVVRHKLGRRCLIEYDIETAGYERPTEVHTLIGKTRAKGIDDSTYHLLISLRNAAFGANSDDGILVPEPVGLIPEFQMWLQQKVPGVNATRLLAAPDGVQLAKRIAEAAHKLHETTIHPTRRHTMADELRVLHERLPWVAEGRPEWANRIERLLDASDRLGAFTPVSSPVGIHRDFYPDQILVDGERLYLLDFDLFCDGDRGVDIGNFVGHMTEYALRTTGDPAALYDREHALVERFVELSGESVRPSIQTYTILTLVRHVSLSTQFPERRHTTAALLELCEERLGI
jgi:hypothetical protein